MDESLTVLRNLIAGDQVTLHGAHIIVDDALVRPIPTKPVPLIVGGRSGAALDRAARLGDGWLGIWISPTRFAAATAAIAALATEIGRETAAFSHGLNVWCGLASSRDRARSAVADAMQAIYRLPFDKFERYSPFGSAAEVTDFLGPYVEAGCTTFNLIPCGDDPDTVITMASEIHNSSPVLVTATMCYFGNERPWCGLRLAQPHAAPLYAHASLGRMTPDSRQKRRLARGRATPVWRARVRHAFLPLPR